MDAAGHLYGTTLHGGAYEAAGYGGGTVFELTPPAKGKTAWTEQVLYSFCPQAGCTDGTLPAAGLIMDAAGHLYGTTISGGNCCGTVFELTPPAEGKTAWTEQVLYSFCPQAGCTDGNLPAVGLIMDAAGHLYGTTIQGGAYKAPFDFGGTVFELTPPAKGKTVWTHNVLYSFCAQSDCTDGASPRGGLIMDATGHLYGTTNEGGAHGGGTVFELTPPAEGRAAWTEQVLYSLCAQGEDNCTDGASPRAGLIMDAAGHLYGTTPEGGAYKAAGSGGGTVFRLTP